MSTSACSLLSPIVQRALPQPKPLFPDLNDQIGHMRAHCTNLAKRVLQSEEPPLAEFQQELEQKVEDWSDRMKGRIASFRSFTDTARRSLDTASLTELEGRSHEELADLKGCAEQSFSRQDRLLTAAEERFAAQHARSMLVLETVQQELACSAAQRRIAAEEVQQRFETCVQTVNVLIAQAEVPVRGVQESVRQTREKFDQLSQQIDRLHTKLDGLEKAQAQLKQDQGCLGSDLVELQGKTVLLQQTIIETIREIQEKEKEQRRFTMFVVGAVLVFVAVPVLFAGGAGVAPAAVAAGDAVGSSISIGFTIAGDGAMTCTLGAAGLGVTIALGASQGSGGGKGAPPNNPVEQERKFHEEQAMQRRAHPEVQAAFIQDAVDRSPMAALVTTSIQQSRRQEQLPRERVQPTTPFRSETTNPILQEQHPQTDGPAREAFIEKKKEQLVEAFRRCPEAEELWKQVEKEGPFSIRFALPTKSWTEN